MPDKMVVFGFFIKKAGGLFMKETRCFFIKEVLGRLFSMLAKVIILIRKTKPK